MKLFPRILLVAAIGSVVAAGAFFAVQARFAQMNPTEMKDDKSVAPDSRPAPSPSGTFEVHIERSTLPQMVVAGLSDKGDVLLQGSDPVDFELHSKGETKQMKSMGSNVRFQLTPSGQLSQLANERTTTGASPLEYPFNESADRFKFYSDGSVAVIRKNVSLSKDSKKPSGDFYAFSRETQYPTDKGMPPGQSGSTMSSPDKRISGIPQQHFNAPKTTKEIYISSKPLQALASDDQSTIWISEREGSKTKSTEKLLKFTNETREEVPLPDGYSNVQRIAATGDKVAGTFGVLNGKLPFRSFTYQDKAWKELPLPNGSECSFVQQIFTDGSMLGYVTKWDGSEMKHILWKGDALVVLDDQAGWPKRGDLALVTRSNRAGDVCIRNITDRTSGNSEYYLVHIKI